MKILPINNYSHYININNRKTNNRPAFTSLHNMQPVYISSKNILTKINNVSPHGNQVFWNQLTDRFSHIDSKEITNIYESCLNSDKTVSKKAEEVLNKICSNCDNEKSRIYCKFGLEGVSTLLNAAKDVNGNHNDRNLDFALWLDKNCEQLANTYFVYDKIRNIFNVCKDDKGICANDSIYAVKQILKDKGAVFVNAEQDDFVYHKKKYINNAKCKIDNKIEKHNINYYTADGMLELLQELKSNNLFNNVGLSMPVCENGDSILMSIPDVVYDSKSKDIFKQIMSMLKEHSGIDYNQKNSFGVSFLEKVINSENFELLDLIKDKNLTYEPILECTYQRIQNPEFKEKIKELSLSFPVLEIIAKEGNWNIFKQYMHLLSSPFFNKKTQIPQLYALCPNKTPLQAYLKDYIQIL